MKVFDNPPIFKKSVLDNGVRILTEHHKYTRATSTGIYIDLGTRDEPPDLVGVAHFVEHILFKGTKLRSAYEIVKTLEAVGGEINAFTSRENTGFHASTLREDVGLSLDVLSDLVANAQFTKEDFEKERYVILQEMDMSADQLDEHIFDLYFEQAFKGHNLARPILGTRETLAGFTPDLVVDFYRNRYCGQNLIVSVAGHVDHDEVVREVQSRLTPHSLKNWHKRTKPQVLPFRDFVHRPSEQVHILMGLPGSSYRDPMRFESYVINAILGGGMTSRLYQNLREKRGWAYAIYSYLHSFTDSSLIMVYAGTSEERTLEVMSLIREEMVSLQQRGVTQSDLDFFKKQVIGNIVLAADDVENRMNSLAVNEMVFGEYRPVDTVIDEVKKVSVDSVQKFLHENFNMDQLGVMLMGPLDHGHELVEKFFKR